jgi:hypothetical protein
MALIPCLTSAFHGSSTENNKQGMTANTAPLCSQHRSMHACIYKHTETPRKETENKSNCDPKRQQPQPSASITHYSMHVCFPKHLCRNSRLGCTWYSCSVPLGSWVLCSQCDDRTVMVIDNPLIIQTMLQKYSPPIKHGSARPKPLWSAQISRP